MFCGIIRPLGLMFLATVWTKTHLAKFHKKYSLVPKFHKKYSLVLLSLFGKSNQNFNSSIGNICIINTSTIYKTKIKNYMSIHSD